MRRIVFTVLLVFSAVILNTNLCDSLRAQNLLGPGVLTTVSPDINYDETYTRQAAVEFLANETKLDDRLEQNVLFDRKQWADEIRFRRDIWCLEFQYKPIRTIWVDIPTKNGVERKLVLYMVYSVTNAGERSAIRTAIDRKIEFPVHKTMEVATCTCDFCVQDVGNSPGNTPGSKKYEVNTPPLLRNQSGSFKPEPIQIPIQFAPQFILASDNILKSAETIVDQDTGDITTKVQRTEAVFFDQIIPIAIARIAEREKMEKLESTVSIAGKTIQPNETVWGVATWIAGDAIGPDKDITDMNFFSVYIRGLTNAYKWEKTAYRKGDPTGSGRELTPKVLKLNFSRPGDTNVRDMNDRQFRIGIQGEVDYEWVYR